MEMETFRDILCRQVDTLQMYFDSCAENEGGSSIHDHIHLGMNDDTFEDDHLGRGTFTKCVALERVGAGPSRGGGVPRVTTPGPGLKGARDDLSTKKL